MLRSIPIQWNLAFQNTLKCIQVHLKIKPKWIELQAKSMGNHSKIHSKCIQIHLRIKPKWLKSKQNQWKPISKCITSHVRLFGILGIGKIPNFKTFRRGCPPSFWTHRRVGGRKAAKITLWGKSSDTP